MADITLQNNQSLTLRLKACGLSSADIKKVIAALSPELENKVDVDLENVTNEVFKSKADLAGVGGGSGGGDGAVFSVNGKTGTVVLTADDVDAYTKQEIEYYINELIAKLIEIVIRPKANNDLSNVDNNAFLDKLNEVLPNGDEVSY